MQKFTFNFYASVTALAVGLIALVVLGFQQVQATTQGKVALADNTQSCSTDTCVASESMDTPHFGGCSTLL